MSAFPIRAAVHGVKEAIACYRKAIEFAPNSAPDANCYLGAVLASQGRFAESLVAYQRGHELGMKWRDWRYPSAEWVRQAEATAALEAKLPAFLKGEFQAAHKQERLGLAGVCQSKKLYHTAADLYAVVFAVDPKLADNLDAEQRYKAAFNAALAAAGQGKDAAKPFKEERPFKAVIIFNQWPQPGVLQREGPA